MADYSWLWRRPGLRPLVVAHRGASALAPENTLAAVRLALAHGAPAVECDVHLSADGVPVVIHDDRVDRTTSGKGLVSALTPALDGRLDGQPCAWVSAALSDGDRAVARGLAPAVPPGSEGTLTVALRNASPQGELGEEPWLAVRALTLYVRAD